MRGGVRERRFQIGGGINMTTASDCTQRTSIRGAPVPSGKGVVRLEKKKED